MSDWKKRIGGQSTELKDNLCNLRVTLVRNNTRIDYVFRRMAGEMEMFNLLIIYMKKLLDSDWLRAVQFKCNTSAKSVTPVQKV